MTDWYVGPSGSSGNAGSLASLWDLTSALAGHSGAVHSGDTLNLRAGTYTGFFQATNLVGTSGARIVVQNFPGERAIIDQAIEVESSCSYVDFRSASTGWLEIANSAPVGTDHIGFFQIGANIRLINVAIHDSGQGAQRKTHGSPGIGATRRGCPEQVLDVVDGVHIAKTQHRREVHRHGGRQGPVENGDMRPPGFIQIGPDPDPTAGGGTARRHIGPPLATRRNPRRETRGRAIEHPQGTRCRLIVRIRIPGRRRERSIGIQHLPRQRVQPIPAKHRRIVAAPVPRGAGRTTPAATGPAFQVFLVRKVGATAGGWVAGASTGDKLGTKPGSTQLMTWDPAAGAGNTWQRGAHAKPTAVPLPGATELVTLGP